MLKKIKLFGRKYWQYIIFAIVILISYGKTLRMYWWVDDWGLLFKMIYPLSAPGNLGAGVLGDGPYRYLAAPFIYLFPIFKYSSELYFALGLTLYFIAAVCLYIFVRDLTKNKFTAFVAGFIFSSGYFGSYALYRLSNSYQVTGTAIFFLLTSIFLLRFYQNKIVKNYIYAVIFFILSLEFFFLRTNGIIFLTACLGLLFFFLKKISFLKMILHQIPFILLYYIYYFRGWAIGPKNVTSMGSGAISDFIDSFIGQGKYYQVLNLLISFVRMIFPSTLLREVFIKLTPGPFYSTGLNLYEVNSIIFCFVFLAVVFGYLLLNYRKQKVNLFYIIFSLLWITSNLIIYFVYSPGSNLESTSRYLIPAFVGTSLFFALLFSLFKHKFIQIILLLTYSAFQIYYVNLEENYILKYVSIPDRQGYELINKSIGYVDSKTVVYVETADEAVYKNNILGGMPQLGISIFKNYSDNVRMASSYEDLIDLIRLQKADLDNVYTYYYDENGYVDTTKKFRELYIKGNTTNSNCTWNKDVLDGRFECVVDKVPNLIGTSFEFSMTVRPKDLNKITYPYLDPLARINVDDYSLENVLISLKNNTQRSSLIQYGKTSSTSNLKGFEPAKAIDGKGDTNWQSDNLIWNERVRPQEITVKLPKAILINNIYWINHHSLTTPSKYSIYLSNDGKIWNKVLEKSESKLRIAGEIVREKITPTYGSYLKFSVRETYGDSPASLDEIWATDFNTSLDPVLMYDIAKCPFCYIKDIYSAKTIYNNAIPTARMRVFWRTNRNPQYILSNSEILPIYLDAKNHTYKVNIPAHGTEITGIKIGEFNLPVEVDIKGGLFSSAPVRLH